MIDRHVCTLIGLATGKTALSIRLPETKRKSFASASIRP